MRPRQFNACSDVIGFEFNLALLVLQWHDLLKDQS